MKNYFVHESSYIDENVTIGNGTKIWHFCHVLPNTKIGENCNIGQNCVIGPDVVIGNNCKIQNNVSIYKGVIIEDDVFVGPSVVFTNVINPRSGFSRKDEFKPTLVKRGSSIGANATIVCDVTLNEYSLIAAGSVVVRDVGEYVVVAGVPATGRGLICQCGNILKLNKPIMIECEICKTRYIKGYWKNNE